MENASLRLALALSELVVRSEESELLAASAGAKGQGKWWKIGGSLGYSRCPSESVLRQLEASFRPKRSCCHPKDDDLWTSLSNELDRVDCKVTKARKESDVPPDPWFADKRADLEELRGVEAPNGEVAFSLSSCVSRLRHCSFTEEGLGHPCCGTWSLFWLFFFSVLFSVGTIGVVAWLRISTDDQATIFAASAGIFVSVGTLLVSLLASLVVYVSKKRALERKRARIRLICHRAERGRGLQSV